jgi:hypothetical protein
MKSTNNAYYLDLGLNPFSPRTRLGFNIVYGVLVISAVLKVALKIGRGNVLADLWVPICLVLSFLMGSYIANRKRFYPEGKYFVSIKEGILSFCGLKDTQTQTYPLASLEYIHWDDERVGFKPYRENWQYIHTTQSKEIFEQLQQALAQLKLKEVEL